MNMNCSRRENVSKICCRCNPRCFGYNFRSSPWRCSVKQGVFRNFANFTGKLLYWTLFLWNYNTNYNTNIIIVHALFNKVAGLKFCNFIKKSLQDRRFLCEYCEFLENTYFEEHLRTTAS